jgi:hypothetical protein
MKITEPTAKTREYLRRKAALHKQLAAENRADRKREREEKRKARAA